MNPFLHPHIVIRAHRPKQQQDNHLQRNTGDNGMVAHREQLGIRVAGRGGDGAADGLDEETRHVKGHKDDGVPFGTNAGDGGVESGAEMFEGEVDGDADQGWGEDDGADLGLKGLFVVGIRTEGHAAGVSCDKRGHHVS